LGEVWPSSYVGWRWQRCITIRRDYVIDGGELRESEGMRPAAGTTELRREAEPRWAVPGRGEMGGAFPPVDPAPVGPAPVGPAPAPALTPAAYRDTMDGSDNIGGSSRPDQEEARSTM